MKLKKITLDIISTYWIILVSPFLLLAPFLLTGKTLFWGTPSLQFIPWWSFVLKSLQQGVLPLWNPYNGMGAPLLANYQVAFFYPPNWTLLLGGLIGGDQGIAFSYVLLSALHLSWAGLGCSLLLRHLGVNWLAQVIGGIAFGISGFFIARLGFFSMIWAAAWLPWVLFFVEKVIVSLINTASYNRPGKIVNHVHLSPGLIACVTLQLLAGHAQFTWYSFLLAGGWCAYRLLTQKSIRAVARGIVSFALAFLIAASLAAAQLIYTFEYLRNSPRAELYAYENAMTYSYWPWRLITVFSPDFFGNPGTGNYWGYASYWEDHFYIGLLPLILAISTVKWVFSDRKTPGHTQFHSIVVGCWLIVLASFIFAMGKNTPVFPFLYWNIPTFGMFQGPTRFLLWAAFGMPVLAAIGVDRWRCPTGKGLYWFRLSTAGAFAVSIGAGLAVIFFEDINHTFIRSTALTGFWGLCFGILTLTLPLAEKMNRLSMWRAGVIVITLSDMVLAGWSLNPGVSRNFYSEMLDIKGKLIQSDRSGRIYIDSQDEFDLKFKRFFRFKDFRPIENWTVLREVLVPNLNLLSGRSFISNFDPLVSWRYLRWTQELDHIGPETRKAWLAFTNVNIIEEIDLREEIGVRYSFIEGAKRWHWYSCATPVTDAEEAWSKIMLEFRDLPDDNRPVILETSKDSETNSCREGQEAQIYLISERPDQISLNVQAIESGWLELMDSWYPGWTVTVSGEKATLIPADFQFKAVYIEKGNHLVVFTYRPFGFYFAILFSILVLLFITIFFLRKNRLSKRGFH